MQRDADSSQPPRGSGSRWDWRLGIFKEKSVTRVLASTPSSIESARADGIGHLALTYAGKRLPLEVYHSAAGHYIGTADADGPVSRESTTYFRSYHAARQALVRGRWQQRLKP